MNYTIYYTLLQPILLSVLKEPVPRAVYDYILRTPLIEMFFDSLHDRQLIRNLCRPGHKPSYSQPEDNQLAQVKKGKIRRDGISYSVCVLFRGQGLS